MGKRFEEQLAKVDKTKVYPVAEAIALVKETSTVKFDASVEAHIRLGINPKKSDQQIRATVVLPHGTGKTKRVAAFVGSNHEQEAKDAGADLILGEEEIAKIKQTGKVDFDIAIATPDMMPKIAVAAKVLGPKGLMPNPKTDTVGTDVKGMVEALKKGKVAFKNDDTANVHLSIGKVSFTEEQLAENLATIMEAIRKVKPTGMKGVYLKGLTLTSSMGPGIRTEIA